MRNIFIIAGRDLRALFNSPVAYVVIGGTMFIIGLLFFVIPHTVVFGAPVGGFWEIDHASVEQMFLYLPALLGLFVIPAVTMRSLAGEKGSGTLELLITMPVREVEVILGKYIAACTVVLILLAATLLYPIMMFWFPWHLGNLDWGPVWAGYLGAIAFSLAGVAIGQMYSGLT
jgi:ABC-2 type transport system permease protein